MWNAYTGCEQSGFLMTMVMTTIHKSSFEGEVDQWLTMVDRIIVYKVSERPIEIFLVLININRGSADMADY